MTLELKSKERSLNRQIQIDTNKMGTDHPFKKITSNSEIIILEMTRNNVTMKKTSIGANTTVV